MPVQFSESDRAELDKVARYHGLTRAAVIRMLVRREWRDVVSKEPVVT